MPIDLEASAARRPSPLEALGRSGLAGLCFLTLMILACVASLPWTLTPEPESAGRIPRYNAGDARVGSLPPAWVALDTQDRARLNALTAEGVVDASRRPILGTDVLGRSLAVRCLSGGGISLGIGAAAALVSVSIGVFYGGIAGFAGGHTDALMMRVVDVLYGLPYILLVVLLAVASDALVEDWLAKGAAMNPPRTVSEGARTVLDLATLLLAIGGVSWLTMARVVRGQVMSLRARPFVEAARALGASPVRIFLRHILPNLVGPIVVYATLTVPQAILQESFLSFLGIGVRPPLPSWGSLAAEGLAELNTYRSRWWLLLFPCLLLGATLLTLNYVGEGLREAFDPKRSRR